MVMWLYSLFSHSIIRKDIILPFRVSHPHGYNICSLKAYGHCHIRHLRLMPLNIYSLLYDSNYTYIHTSRPRRIRLYSIHMHLWVCNKEYRIIRKEEQQKKKKVKEYDTDLDNNVYQYNFRKCVYHGRCCRGKLNQIKSQIEQQQQIKQPNESKYSILTTAL